jgi:hypothetical protein
MAGDDNKDEVEVEEEGREVLFKLGKETKNTFMFSELNEDGDVASATEWLIGSLYVQKSFFEGKTPRGLTVKLLAS